MRKLIRLGIAVAACVALFGGFAQRDASAASFTVNFCPGDATCPVGITEARLTFTEKLGTADVNDYDLVVRIVGNASAPAFLDELQVQISGVNAPAGYQSLPNLTSAPAGATWTTAFDVVPNCATAPLSGNAFCSQSSGNGVAANATNIFAYDVNLAGTFQIGNSTTLNLRAQFLNANGSNAGILSPGGATPGSGTTPGSGSIPEPGSAALGLLGLALMIAALRSRRRGVQRVA